MGGPAIVVTLCLTIDSMAETAENVASEHRVCREDQDRFAHRSQQRAGAAAAAGVFADEIVPIAVPQAKGPAIEVAVDEHPRPGTTLEQLAALKPIVHAPAGMPTEVVAVALLRFCVVPTPTGIAPVHSSLFWARAPASRTIASAAARRGRWSGGWCMLLGRARLGEPPPSGQPPRAPPRSCQLPCCRLPC